MAARNAKRRAKPSFTEPVGTVPQTIDRWMPDYGRTCEVCGESPCVTGMRDGVVVYEGSMCGVCTWGEAACADPANW